MTTARPLRIGIAELRRRLGSRTHVEARAALDHLAISTAAVPDGAEVAVDVELESISNGLVVEGTVTAPWEGECRRCLEVVRGEVEVPVREIFEREPTEGETYRLGEDQVDLEPMVRDAVLLALPLAPLCRPDCAGPAPDAFPTGAGDDDAASERRRAEEARLRDERWSVLDELRFDDGEADAGAEGGA